MINGLHSIVYADDPERARAFFRDVLDLKSVDVHDGWRIFKAPPAELAVHPADADADGAPVAGRHLLYLMCDYLERTSEELTARGVTFTSEVSDQGWGLLRTLSIPGGGEMGLYQPRHPVAYDLP